MQCGAQSGHKERKIGKKKRRTNEPPLELPERERDSLL